MELTSPNFLHKSLKKHKKTHKNIKNCKQNMLPSISVAEFVENTRSELSCASLQLLLILLEPSLCPLRMSLVTASLVSIPVALNFREQWPCNPGWHYCQNYQKANPNTQKGGGGRVLNIVSLSKYQALASKEFHVPNMFTE